MNEDATTKEPKSYKDLPDEKLAEEIEKVSPEGTPAHPEVGPRRIGLFYLSLVFIGLIAGAIIGAMFGPRVGVGFAIVILVLLFINPETWAAFHRARERKRVEKRVKGEAGE